MKKIAMKTSFILFPFVRCYVASALYQITASALIESDQFSVHDRAREQISKPLDYVGNVSVQRLLLAREERHIAAGLDREGSVAIKSYLS